MLIKDVLDTIEQQMRDFPCSQSVDPAIADVMFCHWRGFTLSLLSKMADRAITEDMYLDDISTESRYDPDLFALANECYGKTLRRVFEGME
jgi:hypothetical protein